MFKWALGRKWRTSFSGRHIAIVEFVQWQIDGTFAHVCKMVILMCTDACKLIYSRMRFEEYRSPDREDNAASHFLEV